MAESERPPAPSVDTALRDVVKRYVDKMPTTPCELHLASHVSALLAEVERLKAELEGKASAPPSVCELVVAQIRERAAAGLNKYGAPVKPGSDLRSLLYWLRHALEETLDRAQYERAAIGTVEAMLSALGETKP